ncbi:hypothetical protein TYRP_013225 [Tyrophagus putrescentiae]|nr:hypothetical protein TYRP_013225 [Tyrophagus putrescentiae]
MGRQTKWGRRPLTPIGSPLEALFFTLFSWHSGMKATKRTATVTSPNARPRLQCAVSAAIPSSTTLFSHYHPLMRGSMTGARASIYM